MKEEKELKYIAENFEKYINRFSHIFTQVRTYNNAREYMRGLLSVVSRKNCWQIAAKVCSSPDSQQRILHHSPWDADEALSIMQKYISEEIGEAGGIIILDETGFLKKGNKSVGVQRQYSGTAGKIENCQIGVFAAYASRKGFALIDRELYLPEVWVQNESRCREAKVPRHIQFREKSKIAIDMLNRIWKGPTPSQWVIGDEVYGNRLMRHHIDHNGKYYVLAISNNTPVWRRHPRILQSDKITGSRSGRSDTVIRPSRKSIKTKSVKHVINSLPSSKWKKICVSYGAKGKIMYQWTKIMVCESHKNLPGKRISLIARRSLSDQNDIAYYFSNAPEKISLKRIAQIASRRFNIEQCFRESKNETGLDEYEVRHWNSWYRHITLSMMAYAWLASLRADPNMNFFF